MSDEPLDTPTPGDAEGETLDLPSAQAAASDARDTPGGSSRLTPGTTLAERYRIVTVLGKGGMGEVYRADDLKLDQPVALKFLPPAREADPEGLARLFDEVKVARQISHPNVCRVYDLGEADGVHFLSMEYIDGEDLRSLLRRIGHLPWDKAVELGQQMCDGLGAAHDAGILHRDLKPANVMIDGEGRAKITDFGLAAAAESLRGEDALAGTPFYMAPEQFDGHAATVQSDLYALGLVLAEVFTGHKMFHGKSLAEVRRLHQKEPPTPPSSLRDGFDPAVEEMILRCLAKSAAERPETAAEVAAALFDQAGVVPSGGPRVATLVAAELVSGTELTERLGDTASGDLFQVHDRLVRDLVDAHGGREIEKSEGFLLLFERPLEAVKYALEYHERLQQLGEERGEELVGRIGIHLGEVVLRLNPREDVARGAKPLEVEGHSRTVATELRSLAGGRQTLMTQSAFDLARRSAQGEAEGAQSLRWLAHGDYELAKADETLSLFEVGTEGFAPLEAPEGTADAVRVATEDTILGWRPAPGLEIPHRPSWVVQRKLGEGGFGETWLGSHAKSGEGRVYKFCYEQERLSSLQREITVFRLLKEELGLRDDIARILDWNLEEAPYFIELPHIEEGSLVDWAEAHGGIDTMPLPERLEIVAQTATALAASHSVGVLHKDVKPGNVLITDKTGSHQAVLTDFGIGLITDQRRLEKQGITRLGLTEADATSSGGSTHGTQLYIAPELQAGLPPTTQADLYALGVMLYQLVVGDLHRPLAQGWQRHVEDELLREDIAALVDGNPLRRPGSGTVVAERLRKLEDRRSAREAERAEREAAEKAHRRRRFMTTVAAVASVFLVVVSYLAFQAVRARNDAERRRGQAEQLIDFMLNDLHEGLDKIGRLDLLEGVARSSQEHFESLAERDESPAALYQRGMSLQNIGSILLDQGDAETALLSQQAAVALFAEAAEREPANEGWKQGLSLSRTRLGQVLGERGETEAALAAYGDALRTAEELLARDPDDRGRLFAVAENHYLVARLKRQIGDQEGVTEALRSALEILEPLSSTEEVPWRYHLLLLDTRHLLAEVQRFHHAVPEALGQMRLARQLAERLVAEDPGNAYWPRRLAAIHAETGNELLLQAQLAGDVSIYRDALEPLSAAIAAYRTLTETDSTRVEWRGWLNHCLQLAGWVHAQLGESDRALELYQQAREVIEGLVEQDPDRLSWVRKLASSHQLVAQLHLDQGDTATAEASMVQAIELHRRVAAASGDDPEPQNWVGWALVGLGDIYARSDEPRRAAEAWSEAVELMEPITAVSDVLMYEDTHAQALLRLGRVEESRPLVEGLLAQGYNDPGFLDLVRKSGLAVKLP